MKTRVSRAGPSFPFLPLHILSSFALTYKLAQANIASEKVHAISSPSSTMLYVKYPFKTRTSQSEIPTKIFTSYFQGVKDIYIYIWYKRQGKKTNKDHSKGTFIRFIFKSYPRYHHMLRQFFSYLMLNV